MTAGIGVSDHGPVTTTTPLDPGHRSDGALDRDSTMYEPAPRTEPPTARPAAARRQPEPERGVIKKLRWRLDPEVSWFGPGLIGNGTACGQTLTRKLVGVAHRSLPCGTKIAFRNTRTGVVVVAPVVDRGPFVSGRHWDLTYALCKRLDHCHTGPLEWRRVA
jgi:rare lipoprotein A (peptidoglycan hydrolase)